MAPLQSVLSIVSKTHFPGKKCVKLLFSYSFGDKNKENPP